MSARENSLKIVVHGAGSVGVYIGGALMAAGADVVLLARPRMVARLRQDGILLSDLHGQSLRLAGAHLPLTEDHAVLAQAELVLLTVKSADTAAAAAQIAKFGRPGIVVLSLQNGVGNVDLLGAALPACTVLRGVVAFNVAQLPGGRFHRGTEGGLLTEASPALTPYLPAFAAAGLALEQHGNFLELQWGKLLLNLNNAVNALSGLPLKQQLSQRVWRRCLALLIEEALAVLKAAGIAPARLARVPPRLLPAILRLPDWLFARLAGAMLRIDPQARSSMWEDLQAGRRSEVDYLNGAVLALARQHGRDAPVNARVVALLRAAEQGAAPLAGSALYAQLLAAASQPCAQAPQMM